MYGTISLFQGRNDLRSSQELQLDRHSPTVWIMSPGHISIFCKGNQYVSNGYMFFIEYGLSTF